MTGKRRIDVLEVYTRIEIVEMCSYESDRVPGVSDLKSVADELRAVRVVRQEISSERATRVVLRSAIADRSAPVISVRRTASSVDSAAGRACEQQVTAL
jgi:hypothetical protein